MGEREEESGASEGETKRGVLSSAPLFLSVHFNECILSYIFSAEISFGLNTCAILPLESRKIVSHRPCNSFTSEEVMMIPTFL